MKILNCICICVLVAFLIISVFPSNGEEGIYTQTVRLHVIAQSDSEYDQALKLHVRDTILDKSGDLFDSSTDYEIACNKISDNLENIQEIAELAVKEYGADQSVSVDFGYEEYPVRHYEDFSLPAGEYMSLRITLGEGEGKNWWCVLFPRLCTSVCVSDMHDTCVEDGYSEEQYNLVKRDTGVKYKIRFKILEILNELLF